MANYKLLALDLDGTLLTEEKKITETAKRYIHEAVEQGVTVIFSTGRGIQTTDHLWKEVGLESPMVLLNGAELWKGPGEVVERHVIPKEDIIRLHQLAVDHDAWFWGYSEEALTRKSEWTDEMFERDWMKFGIRHDDLEVIGPLREAVESWGNLEVTRSAAVNMEVSCKGISKLSGVRKVCDWLGIELSEVMAIGDNMNDAKLIRAAGLGVAMGNADEELKRIADENTDTNEQDGVAKAISEYLLGRTYTQAPA